MDTLTILYSVKKFWEDLKWPNSDDLINISKNVSFDICRFAVIYFDNIANRAEECASIKSFGIFQVPIEVCVSINNINFISQGIQKLVLNLAQTLLVDNARLLNIVGNSLKHGSSRVVKLIQVSVECMGATIRKLLLEGAEVRKKDAMLGDRVIVYIEDSLSTLQNDLFKKDFETLKSKLWETILVVFSNVIQKSLEVRRAPIFFSNLRTIFDSLQEIYAGLEFKVDENDIFTEKKKNIDCLLERYGLNTSKLIHFYYKDRYEMQQQLGKSPFNPFGVLTIQCFFINNVLKLEILNAKNLVPLGSKKKCDSFVKINIIPEEMFGNLQKYKTKVESDTHFPLYDELFEL